MQETVGHYRIIEKVGEGGMGVVYQAEDTRLGRTVALKFLPPDLTRDQKAKERFILEARAASAIDHPNVCTIYEVGETAEGQMYIAMAYYDGDTLKSRIAAGVMPLAEAMEIAAQVAKGLARAHALGIVHRDIKPGNILLTRDGQVKIVDFGLAKLAGLVRMTSTGHTLGTVAYMSPEQGRGEEVGPASDIWSLGVVLYEMVTGQLPFRGDHEVAVLYAILNSQPVPIHLLRPGVPMELEHISHRAMSKSPADRYECLEDLLADLGRLKRKLEVDQTATLPSWKYARRRKTRKVALPPGTIRAGKRRLWPWLAAAGAVAAGTGLFVLLQRPAALPENGLAALPGQPRQVTSGDTWQGEPALSPDGTRIAYTSDASGNLDIYIIDVRGGNPLRLTDDPAPDRSPAWFPDGASIAFESGRGGATGIWKVGQLGGGATLLLPNASEPAISPEGERIAFSAPGPGKYSRIAVASLAGLDTPKRLTDDGGGLWGHHNPAWSPDGQTICYHSKDDLWTVPVAGGTARHLTQDGSSDSDPVWSSDGQRIFFASRRGGTLALWTIALENSLPQRLTLGSGGEHHPSLCRDGARLSYATSASNHALVLRDARTGTELKLPGVRGYSLAALSPDGDRVVYASSRGGEFRNLWLQPLQAGRPAGLPQRLTEERGNAACPAWSPDGRWIAYYRITGEERDIYVVPASGGQPVQFTGDPAADTQPAWSPDSARLIFASERESPAGLWVIPVQEGRPAGKARRLTDGQTMALSSAWSPDGRRIAFIGSQSKHFEAWIIPADGSAPARQLTSGAGAVQVRWDALTGDLLVSGSWGEDGLSLRRVPTDGGLPMPLAPPVSFGSLESLATFDVSRDGRYLVFSQENDRGDVWVIDASVGSY